MAARRRRKRVCNGTVETRGSPELHPLCGELFNSMQTKQVTRNCYRNQKLFLTLFIFGSAVLGEETRAFVVRAKQVVLTD